MKNYCIRLIVLYVVCMTCNIIAMEDDLPKNVNFEFPVELSLCDQAIPEFIKKEFKVQAFIENRILMIGDFKDSEDMVSAARGIVLDLYNKDREQSILLCPNMEYQRTDNYHHWVSVERYAKVSNDQGGFFDIPIKARDTNYLGNDLRLLKNSSLILYSLHNKALQVVPKIGNKSSIENSRETHTQQLSFMWDPENNAAPVIVCVDKACIAENLISFLGETFYSGNVNGFLDCLQCTEKEKEQKDVKVIPPIKHGPYKYKKPSFNSLKLLIIPMMIPIGLFLIGYIVYKYKK